MKNIVLVGFMGTGKSVVGRMLAKDLKRPFVDLDERIAKEAGQSIEQLFATEGEAVFRQRESKEVQAVASLQGVVIAAGGGVLLDEENVRALKVSGTLVCLTARPEVILQRTKGTSRVRPLLSGPNPRERIEELLRLRAPSYAQADITIDTSDRPVQEVVVEISRRIHESS